MKPSDSSTKEKIIRNIIVMLDFLIKDVDLNIKFNDLNYIYSGKISKIIFGAVKGINKHKEIHFISIINDLEFIEYIQIDPENILAFNKFTLFKLNYIFVNFKLEYGLFLKDYYTLINTIKITSEFNKIQINFSSRSLNSIFIFLVKIIFLFFRENFLDLSIFIQNKNLKRIIMK